MQYESPFDVDNIYGFPYTFHFSRGGKCFECLTETYYDLLFIDFVFAGILSAGIWYIFKKLKYLIK